MRPVLFQVPIVQLPIFSYGVMLGLSLIVGWYLVLWLCERDGMDREEMGRLYVWTAVWSVVSARLLFIVTNWEHFEMNPFDAVKVWNGGLVAYGGFIGGLLTGIVYCRVKRIRLLAWADCVVPSLGTGLMFTRIGCFLFGCDFGKPAELAWSVRFPVGSPAYKEQLAQRLIDASATSSLPVHPTQIYESLIGLALFALTMLVRRFRRFSGQMFIAFTMGYGVLRYLVETLRADEQRGEVGPLSTSQFIGLVTTVLAVGLLAFLWRRYRRDPPALRYWELPPHYEAASPAPAAATPAASATRPGSGRKRRRR